MITYGMLWGQNLASHCGFCQIEVPLIHVCRIREKGQRPELIFWKGVKEEATDGPESLPEAGTPNR